MNYANRLSEVTDNLVGAAKGSDFGRFVWLLGNRANQSGINGIDRASERFAQHAPRITLVGKAAVAATSTTAAGFVDDISWRGISGEILSLVAQRTVFGLLQPKMRRVPFGVPALTELTPATSHWVGQGLAKPMSTFAVGSGTIDISKICSMVVFTSELFCQFSLATVQSIVDNFVAALAKFADQAFLDPTAAAVAGTSPASITSGLTTTASTGSTAAQISTDLRAMLNRMINTGNDLSGVSIIVHPTTALYLSQVLTTGGDLAFPEMGAIGGTIWKIPVIASLAAGDWGSPTSRMIVAIDARRIIYADDGKMSIDSTREASLQLVTDPIDGAAQLVSLWQCNLQCFRVERFVSWRRADDNGVQIVDGVAY